jgi:putative NIF3 family GTP cyclohydrolase 1 type 2
MSTHLSRRAFNRMTIGTLPMLARRSLAQGKPPTAREIVARIQQHVGVPWRAQTSDTFKAGSEDAVVTGIATTVMSTYGVLEKAAAAKRNLIITHEPTFYTGNDNVAELTENPLYLRKLAFIKEHNLVVWRFHDHWHARRPEPMGAALAQFLGWDRYRVSEDGVYAIPPATLAAIVKDVRSRLRVHAVRVVGDASTRITRVAFLPGTPPPSISVARILPNVDLVIVGEQREWEGIYYAHDAVTSGEKKALIAIGHAISEDPGMKLCADWLKTFISEVPVEWIPAGEPFAKL